MTGKRPALKLVSGEALALKRKPPPELDWSIMMAHAQAGDGDAYRRLLADIVPYLRARALARLGSAEEAEDAVQDTLLTIHEARSSYDPARPFGPWLVAIADRRIADRLRRHCRRQRLYDAVREDETAPDKALPHDKAVLDGRALEAALASLTPEQAEAIRLLKIEERSLMDTAAHTGRTVGALKVATHRALKALRRHLLGEAQR